MAIKKAELHVHLEGTITPDLARSLAQKNGLVLPESIMAEDGQAYTFQDFLHFLKVYDQVAEMIKVPQDYYDVTFDYLKRSAEEGGIYIEMMYSPDHAEMVSKMPSIEHLAAIQQAIKDAEHQYGIIGRIIMTAVRHFGADAAIKVAHHAIKDRLPCVVGFGLGGDEVNFPPKLFTRAYQIASEGGLACTVHAGEHAPAALMMEAMDCLPIQRIGHGVMSIYSPDTMARLIDKNIALELCPSSNVCLKIFPTVAEHPFKKFADAGISVSINSDDPPFFRTHLASEYERVQQTFGYSPEAMQGFTKMAIEASFVDEATKQRLYQKL